MIWKLTIGLVTAGWLFASLRQHFLVYDLGRNDCKHMSVRQAKFFEKLGFGADFWEAELEGRENHVFLKLGIGPFRVEWEPTCLLPVPVKLWFYGDFVDSWEISKEDINLSTEEIKELENNLW